MVLYWICTTEVVGLLPILVQLQATLSKLLILCAQTNVALYPYRDGKWVVTHTGTPPSVGYGVKAL